MTRANEAPIAPDMEELAEVFLIAGPTGAGKSAFALALAEATGGEVVNADAMQVYRDLRILSARPSPEDEARAPHHLFGVVDGAASWSVGKWQAAAAQVLADIAARGRPAIVVGGTGLYFRALTTGLAAIPQVPPEVRAATARTFDLLGEAAFREQLREHDPAAAERIYAGDRQRLSRAWEVFEATGRALSDWQGATGPGPLGERGRAVAIEPTRDVLYARCDARFEAMVTGGALAEVEALVARGLGPAAPVMKAVGVRELAGHLSGELSLEQAVEQAQRETRRYAKRQLTWLRRQTPDWPRVASEGADAWDQFSQALGLGGKSLRQSPP